MDRSFTIFFITRFLVVWFLAAVIFDAAKLASKRSGTAQIKVKRGVIHQRLANQGQQPLPPRSAMPPLKKPKK